MVREQFLVFSRTECTYGPGACREPTSLISNECNGAQTCQVAFGLEEMSLCSSDYADGLDFSFLCVPGSINKT